MAVVAVKELSIGSRVLIGTIEPERYKQCGPGIMKLALDGKHPLTGQGGTIVGKKDYYHRVRLESGVEEDFLRSELKIAEQDAPMLMVKKSFLGRLSSFFSKN